MRKVLLLLITVWCAIGAHAVNVLPKTVQGIQYSQTLPEIKPGMTFSDQVYAAAPSGQFTFDMIESWAGEGSNEAALVIQWNTGKDNVALVFGYRWNGTATGADMIKAVAKANPRLYTLMQYTNVSSPTDPNGGYTINGFGWDADDNGLIKLRDTGDKTVAGGKIYESEDGFFEHPRGYVPGQGGSSDYDYDNWEAVDPNDWWQAGWYSKGFWSYWCKDSATGNFGFSGVGASGRILKNGSWDGWNFSVGFSNSDWHPFEAAPAPIPANAKIEFTVGGICYKLKNYTSKTVTVVAPLVVDGKAVVEYTGNVTIPTTFVDENITYTVVGVGEGAFQGSKVTKITLPSTVTEIGNMAFEGSTLSDINVTDAIKKIGDYAFMGCQIAAPFFPTGITEIGAGTYYGTGITSAIIPSTITAIGDNAFSDCAKLSTIDIPVSVKTMGSEVFSGCTAVTSVSVHGTYPLPIATNLFSTETYANATLNVPQGFKPAYAKATGWSNFTNVKEFTIDVNVGDKFALDGVTYVITNLGDNSTVKVSYCNFEGKASYSAIRAANKEGYVGEITIPNEIYYQNKKLTVTEINDSAFTGATELLKVTLPQTITAIPKHAFNGCGKLGSVNIPATVTAIGDYAFSNCSVLTDVVLPEGLLSIGRNAFASCSKLNDVVIPAGITVIPQYAFQNCASIQSMILGNQITSVEMYAFSGCAGLKNVQLPDGLKELAQATFSGCEALTSLAIPETVTKFGNYVFDGCKNLVIDIPQQVTSIGQNTFRGCVSLKKITIPSAITAIPNYLMANCTGLEQVTMSDKVTQIGSYAFQGCRALTTINIAENSTDESSNGYCKLPSKLKNIMTYGFKDCTSLKLDAKMPASLTQLGNYTFAGMKLLDKIILPEGFTTFGQYNFQNTSLTEVVIPKSVTNIRINYVFAGCNGLKVYITNPVPGDIYTNTFKNTSSTYVTVIVPSGTKATFDAKSNYWKNTKVTEPELAVAFDKSEAEATANSAEISATFSVNYVDTELPERFKTANAENLKKGSVKLMYKASADTAGEKMAVDATVTDDNNTVSAQLTGLTASTTYTYNWSYALGSVTAESSDNEFTTGSTTTGIDGIYGDAKSITYANGQLHLSNYAGYTFNVCDFSGITYCSVNCHDEQTTVDLNLAAGAYIVYGRSDTDVISKKIMVK